MTSQHVALGLWIVAFCLACGAIVAPNGFPLLLGACAVYCLAWVFYKPKGIR